MNSSLNEALTAQLQEFVNRLKSRIPETNIELEVRQWPSDKNSNHSLVLQVMNPAFQFNLQADGENLDKVLSDLEATFADQIGQRKALTLMLLEGIESQSPQYSGYLH
ncbi:MAG: hypothetical protein KDD40_00235 [Bdellovibrionales bacterium]|nr:hypothetical protein [Bdellovibrionales bacterium]